MDKDNLAPGTRVTHELYGAGAVVTDPRTRAMGPHRTRTEVEVLFDENLHGRPRNIDASELLEE